MAEWKRVFCTRRVCIGILLILLINGILFVQEQAATDYGLDCTIPAASVSVSLMGGYEVQQETVNSRDAYTCYLEWLNRYKDLLLTDTISQLETEKQRLMEILTLSDYLEDDSGILAAETIKQYQEEKPELVQQLKDGEIDLSEIRLNYVAVNNLLQQTAYLDSYDDYLNTIQENKESMLSFSIFNDPDSFTGRNIIKTAEEFAALENIPLSLGANGVVKALLDFQISDYLLLAVLVLICLSFLEERKNGLWNVVHATPNGRLRLALYRTSILFMTSVISVLLLYGTNLLIGFSLYGGIEDLDRAAQSVEILGKLPLDCNVASFLFRYFILRIGAAFLVGLLLWLLLTAVNNVKYTIIVTAAVMAAEYSLYAFLPVQSALNVLKYFNVFTYISLSDLYTNYLNIDILGYPLGIRSISQASLLPLCVVLAAVCIVIHCCKKPSAGKDLLGRVAYRLNSITDSILRRLHLSGMEIYKTVWLQKGLVIILLFAYLASGLSFTVSIPVSTAEESAARQYTAALEGEITNATFAEIDRIQAELDKTIAAYEEAKTAYESGEMEYPQFDVYVREANTAKSNSDGLDVVRRRAEELRDKGLERGFTPWLIEETSYESVYGDAAGNNQQSAALVALLALGLLLAGNMSYEQQSGMTSLLLSTMKGRRALLTRKILLAVATATGIWAVIYGLELHAFFGIYKIDTLSASVQNLTLLDCLPQGCTIGMFLIMLYALRLLTLICAAMVTLLLSSCMKRVDVSYIFVCGVLLLPSLLYFYVGLEPLKYLSFTLPMGAMSLVQTAQPIISLIVVCGVMIVLIGTSICLLRKKLRIKRKTN